MSDAPLKIFLAYLLTFIAAFQLGDREIVVARGCAAEPPITALAFSPDGNSILAGSQRGLTEYAWPSLTRMREIDSKVGNVHAIVFAPGGRTIAVAGGAPSEEGIVDFYSWPGGEPKQSISGHSDSVMSVTWIDDSTLVTASLDHHVLVWDLPSERPTLSLAGHSKGVTAVCWLGNESRLISAGIDQSLRVWNIESGELLRSLNNHTGPVHAVALRPGNSRLSMVVSASDDKTVRLWQPSIGRMVRFVRLPSVPLDVGWSVDGSQIVAACADGHLRVIDPDTIELLMEVSLIDGWAYTLAVHPNDGSVAVGGSNGQVERLRLDSPP